MSYNTKVMLKNDGYLEAKNATYTVKNLASYSIPFREYP
jgi:hypothetical protein